MKKKNIKNILLILVLLVCAMVVFHDLYLLIIYPLLTTNLVGFTWFGFLTFLIAIITGSLIIDYFIGVLNIYENK